MGTCRLLRVCDIIIIMGSRFCVLCFPIFSFPICMNSRISLTISDYPRFLEESQVSSAYGTAVSLVVVLQYVDKIEISSVISLSVLADIRYL